MPAIIIRAEREAKFIRTECVQTDLAPGENIATRLRETLVDVLERLEPLAPEHWMDPIEPLPSDDGRGFAATAF